MDAVQHVEVMGLNIGLAILIKLILKAVLSHKCVGWVHLLWFLLKRCANEVHILCAENLNEMFKEVCYV